MKLLKPLLWLVVILIVLLVGVGLFVDSLARKSIEAAATDALGVPTTLDDVNVGFVSSTFSLGGLSVDNPKNAGDGQFLTLGTGAIEVSAASLMGDKVEVPELVLKDITVNLVKTATGSNYETILDNLDRYQGGASGGTEGGAASEEEGKRFIISRLLIENVNVNVQPAKELNLGRVSVPIDRIELTDIGSESDTGVLLSDVAGIVIEAILKKASVSGRLPGLIKGALDGKLRDLSGLEDAGIKALDGILDGGVPADPGKALDDVKKKLGEGLKGFGLGR